MTFLKCNELRTFLSGTFQYLFLYFMLHRRYINPIERLWSDFFILNTIINGRMWNLMLHNLPAY